MRVFLRLGLFIAIGLCLSFFAQAEEVSTESIIPLSFTLGAAVVPGKSDQNVVFLPSYLIQLELLYRIKGNLGGGLGASFIDRRFQTDKPVKQYNITTLYWMLQWHPNYASRKGSFYLGSKLNTHVVRYGEKGGLDSEEQGEATWGVEPYFGVLLPLYLSHQFLDVSLGYQWRRFPQLYHLQPEQQVKNVDDSQMLLTFKLRI